jgi:transcriptional regulator with XRE-family HTH domain
MEARKRAGLTQEELAARVGYKTKSAINKIELGSRDLPQKKIMQFAEALGTTPAVLMGWVQEESGQRTTELAQLYKRMRLDDDFYRMVQKLDKLSETQLDSIKQLLNAFFPDK